MAFHAKLKEASTQGDWSLPIQFIDRASGSLVDLSGDTFQLALVPCTPPGSTAPVLAASSSDGSGALTLPSTGILNVYFPVSMMRSLVPGMYKVGLTVSNGTLTAQLIIGYLPVRDGIVMPPQSFTGY